MDVEAKLNTIFKDTCLDNGLGLVQMSDIDGTLLKMVRESKKNGIELESVTTLAESITPLEAYYLGLGTGATIRKEIEYIEKKKASMKAGEYSMTELIEMLTR
jgi:hypothetical protein